MSWSGVMSVKIFIGKIQTGLNFLISPGIYYYIIKYNDGKSRLMGKIFVVKQKNNPKSQITNLKKGR
jgi:hypothetical protein